MQCRTAPSGWPGRGTGRVRHGRPPSGGHEPGRHALVSGGRTAAHRPVSADLSGDTVTQLTWSPDGRYLAWVQGVSGNLDQELVRYDTRAGTYATWLNPQEMGIISFSGSQPVTISGSFLYKFQAGGSTSPIALAAEPGTSTASYDDGFVFPANNSSAMNDQVAMWRAAANGEITQVGSLPATGNLSEYAQLAASPSGQWVALEKGDHTDVCGDGPSSRLIVLNTATGAATSPSLPVAANTVWRFGSIMYGADSVLDFSAYQVSICDADVSFPTRLFELDHGKLHVVADNVTAGQRGPHGQFAVVTGQDAFKVINEELPDLGIDGKQQLEVNGKVISLPTTPASIDWAPQNP